MDMNISLWLLFKDFPNSKILGFLGSSLKSRSIISSINIWDPSSNLLGTGIQFLSSRLYSSSSPIFYSIRVVFMMDSKVWNITFISLNSCIIGFLKMSEQSAISSLTMKCDEELFELIRLHGSNSSLPNQ